jgi:hypothetical protein
MVNIRPIDQIVNKWQNRASGAATDYEAGVRQPMSDWATNAAAAEQNYQQGINAAIARKAFSKGIREAGTEKWQRKAIQKGAARYSQGVSMGVQEYSEGFKAVHDTLSRLTLPARGAKGDPKNLERVRAVVNALRQMKTGTTT